MKKNMFTSSTFSRLGKTLLIAAAGLILFASCGKEKNCRCSVKGSQVVRIITLNGGDCEKIYYVRHFDQLDTMFYDTVFCTDYPFAADSLVVYSDEAN